MLNTCAIQGRICADPELRYTNNDIAVTSFCIANDAGYGDNKKTNFIDCVAWRKTAELVCKWFKKGSAIIVDGSIQTRSYTDNQGNKRKAFEVVANNVHFAESKKSISPEASVDNSDFVEIAGDDDLPF